MRPALERWKPVLLGRPAGERGRAVRSLRRKGKNRSWFLDALLHSIPLRGDSAARRDRPEIHGDDEQRLLPGDDRRSVLLGLQRLRSTRYRYNRQPLARTDA